MANFYKTIIDMFIEFCSTATAKEILDTVKSAEDIKNEFDASHALIAASAKNTPGVISALISAGMNPNTQSFDGSTPLMFAARSNSALILAAMLNNPQVVTALISAGSNANAKDSDGKNALYYARGNQKISGAPEMSLLEEITTL